jgi:hypothetical protein
VSSAEEILKIKIREIFEQFSRSKIIAKSTRDKIEKIGRGLVVYGTGTPPPPPPPPEEIYTEFMQVAPFGLEKLAQKFDSKRDLKNLALILDYSSNGKTSILNSRFLELTLLFFDRQWCNSLLNILVDILLKNWTEINPANAPLFREFIRKKVLNYTGKRPFLLTIQKERKFFLEADGAVQLGTYLLTSNRSIKDGISFFRLPDYVKSYSYFSNVVWAFTQSAMRTQNFEQYIPGILDFLREQKQRDTSKKCLSGIILKIEGKTDIQLRDKVQNAAFELIGDPAIKAYWSPWNGAFNKEGEELEKARQIVNDWITEKFIELFFSQLAMDQERKEFWLLHKNIIQSFRIYCDNYRLRKLKRDNRITTYIESRFGILSGGGSDQSAMVFKVKNYIFVEFSQKGGAFYAYLDTNPLKPDMNVQNTPITKLRKHQKMDLLFHVSGNFRYENRREGYRPHIPTNSWHFHLANWIHEYVKG